MSRILLQSAVSTPAPALDETNAALPHDPTVNGQQSGSGQEAFEDMLNSNNSSAAPAASASQQTSAKKSTAENSSSSGKKPSSTSQTSDSVAQTAAMQMAAAGLLQVPIVNPVPAKSDGNTQTATGGSLAGKSAVQSGPSLPGVAPEAGASAQATALATNSAKKEQQPNPPAAVQTPAIATAEATQASAAGNAATAATAESLGADVHVISSSAEASAVTPQPATQSPTAQTLDPHVSTSAALTRVQTRAAVTGVASSGGATVSKNRQNFASAENAAASAKSGMSAAENNSDAALSSSKGASSKSVPAVLLPASIRNGTTIAKQSAAMSYRAQLPETEGTFHITSAATAAAGKSHVATPAAATTSAVPQTAVNPAVVSSIAATQAPKFATVSSAAPVSQPAMTTLIQRVVEPAERLTSSSDSHVEIQVNLGQGQQVTVRLQMIQGTVQPIFKSTSPELRQAIEQNWGGFRTASTERGLQIAAPVFEGSGTQTGFNASSNRNSGNQPEAQDAEFAQTPSRPQQTATSASPSAQQITTTESAPASGMQIYA
jgi:hypothetical protein